ncbi:MAG: helix-turn-helix domain-containing protein, partial [Candidatus Paceibacterota bacterium]
MKILKELKKLGLSEKEAQIYLAILDQGRATTIEIAKKTSIKRTTVYSIVMDLIEAGYVAEAKKGKRRLFIVEDPALLIGKFEQNLSDVKYLVPLLNTLRSKTVPRPLVKFYDGINGVRNIMEETVLMYGKEQFWWSAINDLVDVLGKRYISQWVRRRVKRKIKTIVLRINDKNLEPEFQASEHGMREIHWLPQKVLFNGALCVFDNKVAYLSSRKESFGFIIESNDFSDMVRTIFSSMWEMTTQNLQGPPTLL